jgi:hypothetical protein
MRLSSTLKFNITTEGSNKWQQPVITRAVTGDSVARLIKYWTQ